MTNEKIKAQTAKENAEQTDLPDLTRLLTKRARDGDIIQKCKHLLIAGYSPGRVACLLRLPLEKVQDLYSSSYNPTCRRFTKTNAYTNARLALTSSLEGASLADICIALGLPLFTFVIMLWDIQVSESAINDRIPTADDPLCNEHRLVRNSVASV